MIRAFLAIRNTTNTEPSPSSFPSGKVNTTVRSNCCRGTHHLNAVSLQGPPKLKLQRALKDLTLTKCLNLHAYRAEVLARAQ